MKTKTLYLLLMCSIIISFQSFAQQRLYELVDIRTDGNEALASGNPIANIIYEAATSGRKGVTIKAYADTNFTRELTKKEILNIGGYYDTITMHPDPDDFNFTKDTVILNPFSASSIVQWVLMEETVENKDGITLYNIVAIAPVINDYLGNTETTSRPMFWVKFEDLKAVLAKEPFMSYENRSGRLKFDYYFDKRMFKTEEMPSNFVF